MKKLTDSESSTSINDSIIEKINISENISSHQKLSEIIDNTQDDNGIHLGKTEE